MTGFLQSVLNLIASEDALFIWKTLATFATAAFGIYGLDLKSRDESGRFTAKGKVVLFGLILSALIAATIQTGEFIQGQRSAAEELTRSQQLLGSVERNLYPLEPLSATFDFEYSMDDPAFRKYSARLQSLIVKDLRDKRQGRGSTSDDLHDETEIAFIVSNYPHEFHPGSDPDDGQASFLTEDYTELHFTSVSQHSEPSITFASSDPSLARAIAKYPSVAPVTQSIELKAYYPTRTFTKHVVARNLIRLGDNTLAKGAGDLADHAMTWGSLIESPAGRLLRFGLRLPFDYEVDSPLFKRIIDVPKGTSQIAITRRIVGLDISPINPK